MTTLAEGATRPPGSTFLSRYAAWVATAYLFGFLVNVYLSFWRKWPGAGSAFGDAAAPASWAQVGVYVLCVALPAVFVARTPARTLRADAAAIGAIAMYIVKTAFWIVLLVGIVDAVISFLRVENLLSALVGDEMTSALGRNRFRGPYVHGPLILLSLILAATTRTLGFTWLALLVVVAELQIVISRFVFSYEQAFMGDLVRMWYAGLFLFSSAFTLVEDGHVRVDVLYSGFNSRTRGLVNAGGALLLGLPLCWTILVLGMSQSSSIITSPILSWEVTQSGFGMYIKYLMAGFLAVFACSMALQFSALFLEGVADYREEPGAREPDAAAAAH